VRFRVNTRPRQGWSATLPIGYADQIREMPGVRHAAASRMAALRLPGKDKVFFASRATEMEPYLAMVDELEAPAEQKHAFLADERGAFVPRRWRPSRAGSSAIASCSTAGLCQGSGR
jgi:hypothetical protein